MSIQSFYLKEDANSCQGSHPHGEWCLSVTVSLSGPNPTVSRRDFVAGLFETPLNSREAAEQVARAINRARFGKTVCPACGGRLTFNGGCPNPQCSLVHDAVPDKFCADDRCICGHMGFRHMQADLSGWPCDLEGCGCLSFVLHPTYAKFKLGDGEVGQAVADRDTVSER